MSRVRVIFAIVVLLLGVYGYGWGQWHMDGKTIPIFPDGEGGYRSPVVGRTGGALSTIEYVHRKVDEGIHFELDDWVLLGSGATRAIVFWTPQGTTRRVHLLFTLASSNILEAWITEGMQASGSGITPFYYNSKRDSGNTSFMTSIMRDPPRGFVANTGVTLKATKFGTAGSVQKQAVGGSATSAHEIICKSGTTYVLYMISGAADNIVDYSASWYEE